jgi:hypothetical protein
MKEQATRKSFKVGQVPNLAGAWEVTGDFGDSPRRFRTQFLAIDWARQLARTSAPSQLTIEMSTGRTLVSRYEKHLIK